MRSFEVTHGQLVRLCAALCADELARSFGRYVESLTQSSWGAKTPLGPGGADLTREQAAACARRASIFFGQPEDALTPAEGDLFGDWADALAGMIRRELVAFRFHPATHGGVADTRHPADEVYQDARAVAGLMQGRRRAVSLIATAGLMGWVAAVLAPNLQRLEVMDARPLTPDELAEALRFGDVVIATPTLWRYLADTLPAVPDNVVGISYGEALGQDLAGRLRGRGLGGMRELYGSTETGVVGWRDSPQEPFVLFDHWRREGEALVRSRPGGGTHSTLAMDAFDWRGARSFALGGRRDGAVQIAGVNVFPRKIGEVIAGHEAAESCTVRLSQRPGALDRLIAHVTLRPGLSADQALAWSVDEWCRKRLQPPERPRIYTFQEAGQEPAQEGPRDAGRSLGQEPGPAEAGA